MDSIISFFEMGGYAGYVWPAYGITAIVMVALLVTTLRSLRGRENDLRLLQESRPNRRRRRAAATEKELTGDA